jgi:hypothetical protein
LPQCVGGFREERPEQVDDLVDKVMTFIADYNCTAKPFRWTYDGRPLKAS